MEFMTIFLTALVVLAVVFVKMAVVIIPQSETKIIERLGRYYATLSPGVNIIIPFNHRPPRAGVRLRQAERNHEG